MRLWDAGPSFEFYTLKIALRRYGNAAKHVLVEAGKRLPIFGDEIGMDVSRGNGFYRTKFCHKLKRMIAPSPLKRPSVASPLSPGEGERQKLVSGVRGWEFFIYLFS